MNKKGKIRIILLLLVLITAFIYIMIPNVLKWMYPLYFEEFIGEYTAEYHIDPPLLAAVIKTESNFDPLALSQKDARGLMQITPSTGQWIAEKLDVKNFNADMLYDPEINIRFGCWYINYLYQRYNRDFDLVFAAYNGGLGNVDKWLKDKNLSTDGKKLTDIPFKETKNFIIRIRKNHEVYNRLYEWNNK